MALGRCKVQECGCGIPVATTLPSFGRALGACGQQPHANAWMLLSRNGR